MKRNGKIIAAGIVLGVCMALIENGLDIDRSILMRYYWTGAIVVIAAAIVINVVYTKRYYNAMVRAADILNQGDAEEYIAVVSELERKARGSALKNLFRLNLTAGYCDLKQYEKALGILEELEGEKLRGDADLVWRLNTCCCYFYLGRGEEGVRWYEENQKHFKKAQARGQHPGNVAVLEMFYLIETKRYSEARQLLEQARKEWNEFRLQDDYQMIEEMLVGKVG